MKEVFIKYNPYRQLTEITVAGRALAENSGIRDLARLEDEDPPRFHEWIGELPELLQDEYNDDEFEVTFHGLLRDFDTLKSTFRDAENKGILIAELMREPAKEPEDIVALIDRLFQDIQSEKSLVTDLIDQELHNGYVEVNGGNIEACAEFASMFKKKLEEQIKELNSQCALYQKEYERLKKEIEKNNEKNTAENKQFVEIIADFKETEKAVGEIIGKYQQNAKRCPRNHFISVDDVTIEVIRLVEFIQKQREEYPVEIKQWIESQLDPSIAQVNQWLADLPGAEDIIIRSFKPGCESVLSDDFDKNRCMDYYESRKELNASKFVKFIKKVYEDDYKTDKGIDARRLARDFHDPIYGFFYCYYQKGKGTDTHKLAMDFLKPLEDLFDKQEKDVSDYFARLNRIFKEEIKPLVDLAAQKQAEQSRDYSTELSEAEQRVIEADKKIKWLKDDIFPKLDTLFDF